MSKILNVDFNSLIIYEYSSIYNCFDNACNDICRCGAINKTKITHIDIDNIVKKIYKIYFDNSKQTNRNNKNFFIGGIAGHTNVSPSKIFF